MKNGKDKRYLMSRRRRSTLADITEEWDKDVFSMRRDKNYGRS